MYLGCWDTLGVPIYKYDRFLMTGHTLCAWAYFVCLDKLGMVEHVSVIAACLLLVKLFASMLVTSVTYLHHLCKYVSRLCLSVRLLVAKSWPVCWSRRFVIQFVTGQIFVSMLFASVCPSVSLSFCPSVDNFEHRYHTRYQSYQCNLLEILRFVNIGTSKFVCLF